MSSSDFKIVGMTMAITKMDQMLHFYKTLFEIDFIEKEMYGAKLYSGKWGDWDLLFCPAEIARNSAQQNRHQFDIVIKDIHAVIKFAESNGGSIMGEIAEDDTSMSVGIYDPDQNSIIFKQYK